MLKQKVPLALMAFQINSSRNSGSTLDILFLNWLKAAMRQGTLQIILKGQRGKVLRCAVVEFVSMSSMLVLVEVGADSML